MPRKRRPPPKRFLMARRRTRLPRLATRRMGASADLLAVLSGNSTSRPTVARARCELARAWLSGAVPCSEVGFLSTIIFMLFFGAQKLGSFCRPTMRQTSLWQGFSGRRQGNTRGVFSRGWSKTLRGPEFLSSGAGCLNSRSQAQWQPCDPSALGASL